MRNEFTAIIEYEEGWFTACCPEVPGANGQGRTREEAVRSLREAIALIRQKHTGATNEAGHDELARELFRHYDSEEGQ